MTRMAGRRPTTAATCRPELVAPMVAPSSPTRTARSPARSTPRRGPVRRASSSPRRRVRSTPGGHQRSRTSPRTGRPSTTRPATTSRPISWTGPAAFMATCRRSGVSSDGLLADRSGARPRRLVPRLRPEGDRAAGPRGVGGGAVCPPTCCGRWASSGLLGMLVPEEWGGIGMSTVGFVAAMEQIGLADQSVAAAWQAHVTIGSLPLLLFGNDEQRERWLRPLAEGRALGAFGLTEPDAGSDARGIRTRAEQRDGGWLINGRKTFISNAGTDMSFGVTLATPRADGRRLRHVRGREGHARLHDGPEDAGHRLEGPRHSRELYFDDVWVPDDHLVGDPDMGLSQFLARSRSAASRSPPCRSASPRPSSTWRPTTPSSGSSSASRSRSSRRSSSSWPTSPPSWRPPAGSPTAPPTCATPASRSSRRRRWPSSRPAGWRSRRRRRRSRSTAASATCWSPRWPASTATPRCWRSARAPTRSSTWYRPQLGC